jgi:hypothetical protein
MFMHLTLQAVEIHLSKMTDLYNQIKLWVSSMVVQPEAMETASV